MTTTRIAHPLPSFTLTRVYRDGREEVVETATDHTSGTEAGHRLSRTDLDHGFTLYKGERRVAKFAHHRLVLRLKPSSVEMIVAL